MKDEEIDSTCIKDSYYMDKMKSPSKNIIIILVLYYVQFRLEIRKIYTININIINNNIINNRYCVNRIVCRTMYY